MFRGVWGYRATDVARMLGLPVAEIDASPERGS